MKKIISVITIFVILSVGLGLVVGIGIGQTDIYENFDPPAYNWLPMEGQWAVEEDNTAPSPPNVYSAEAQGSSHPTRLGSSFMEGGDSWMNYTVEVMVKLVDGGCSEAFITVYVQDADNLFIMGIGGFGYRANIEVRQYGTFSILEGVGSRGELELGVWYKITGQVFTYPDGDSVNLKLWLNGIFQCEYTFSSSKDEGPHPTQGGVGLLIYNAHVHFDDFEVSFEPLTPKPPETESWSKDFVVQPPLVESDSIKTEIYLSGTFTTEEEQSVTVTLINNGAKFSQGTVNISIVENGVVIQNLEQDLPITISAGGSWSKTYIFTLVEAGNYSINVDYTHT